MPTLLAFDTTGERLSLALARDGSTRRRRARPSRDQDDILPGEARRLLRASGLGLEDVDAFVAATGPGRFTGIRVGLTFADMLARGLGKAAVGVSWLEACAWRSEPGAGRLVAVVPGWRGEFFFQAFERASGPPRPQRPPRWADPGTLGRAIEDDVEGADALLIGPGAKGALGLVAGLRAAEAGGAPLEASDLLAPAAERLARGGGLELAPLYIKPAHYER